MFHYVVTGAGDDATDLRTIHDWVIRPQVRAVRRTAEVNSWGGVEKQYQVRVDPARLVKHDLTFGQVTEAVGMNNRNVGGGTIRQNGQALLVHGRGRTATVEQVGNIVVTARDGVPVRVKDVADVPVGSEVRRGAVTADGKGNVVRLAGTDLEESVRANTQTEKAILAAFPDEVAHVWSRIGTAEVATDPMGVELTDVFISLKPRPQWTKAHTHAELTVLIERELRAIPGQKLSFSQPLELRINEMLTGVRSDVAVKVYGDDLDALTAKAQEVEAVLRTVPGAADVNVEQVTGQPVLAVQVRQDQIARYGVPAKAVLDLVESVGSKPLGEVVEGQVQFPLVVRLPESYRASPEAVGEMLVAAPGGERVPLSRLADVKVVEGPSTITRARGCRWTRRCGRRPSPGCGRGTRHGGRVMRVLTIRAALAATLLGRAGLVGCGGTGGGQSQTSGKGKETAGVKKEHDHSDWWCNEHGIRGDECSMCSPQVAKEFKSKGDWCDTHDRAKSQCFICDPSLKEKYAAKYRAKYGKEPPPFPEEKGEKK